MGFVGLTSVLKVILENLVACELDICHLGHWMIKACAYDKDLCTQNSCSSVEAVIKPVSWKARKPGGDFIPGTWHIT